MSKYNYQLTFMHYIMIIQNFSLIVIHNPKVESKHPKHIMSISLHKVRVKNFAVVGFIHIIGCSDLVDKNHLQF